MSRDISLKDKTVYGVGWSAVDSIASQGITFLVGLVLARLLTPSEYGLIGMITIFISLSNTIVDGGFSNAIIRKPEVTNDDYSTMFVFNMLLSLVLYFALFMCSPYIANFFHQSQLIELTRVLGLIVIINSIVIVQRTKLVREIDFKRQAIVSVISSTTSGIVGIGMALWGFGVWSLVAQQLSRQIVNSIGLWVTAHWKPSFIFSISSFKYQFNFGWKLLLSQLLNTIFNEANNIIIGRCYSSAILGQYSRAHQFSSLFSTNITGIVQRVSFPVLSTIQDDLSRLKANYKKIIQSTMFVSCIGMFSLAACSRPLVYVLIGEKWGMAADIIPILCYNFVLYPVRAINTNMLQVVGRTDQLLILEVIKKIIYLVPLSLGVFIGIYWMLWGNVIVGILGYCLNSYFSGKYINYTTWQQFVDILPCLVYGFFVAIMMYFITLLGLSNLITLIVQIVLGIFLTISIGEFFKFVPYLELKESTLSLLSKLHQG